MEIVDSIDELIKRVDVVLILSIDGRKHLEEAKPVFAAGKVYFASDRGVITVIDSQSPKLEILSKNDLKEVIMATAAMVDGKVYVRTHEHLYAFGR